MGTGKGTSVLQVLDSMSQLVGFSIPFQLTKRRSGDVSIAIACTDKIQKDLNWFPIRNFDVMCLDTWNWKSLNPQGFPSSSSSTLDSRNSFFNCNEGNSDKALMRNEGFERKEKVGFEMNKAINLSFQDFIELLKSSLVGVCQSNEDKLILSQVLMDLDLEIDLL